MKTKIFLVAICTFCAITSAAQNYHFLSNEEINECKSPQAVAWNFVMSVINCDYQRMLDFVDPSFTKMIDDYYFNELGLKSYSEVFTEGRIQDICGMRPLLKEGYQIACSDEYYHKMNFTDVEESYKDIPTCSVRFVCVDVYGQFYSGNEHDADARVILVFKDNKWRVFSFK
ncbi:MAG: hypothetical protein K5660_07655 [Paludibacteraceae bacterium]|nr:hypothetical protein [Paludibacteraceae bacterium]